MFLKDYIDICPTYEQTLKSLFHSYMIKTKTLKESGPEKIADFIVNYRSRENMTFQFLSQQCIQPLNIDFSSQDKCGCFIRLPLIKFKN